MKLVLPPRPAKSIDAVRRRPEFGKIGLSTVLWTKLGVTLLIVRLPPSPISSESCRNGLRCDQLGRVVDRVQVRHLDGFVAVGQEHPREVGHREART